jgi:hypothetical protein
MDLAEIGLQLDNGMVGTVHLDYFRSLATMKWKLSDPMASSMG